MSNETNSDEIHVEVLSENETDSSNKIEELDNNDNTSEDLSKLLELEKQKMRLNLSGLKKLEKK